VDQEVQVFHHIQVDQVVLEPLDLVDLEFQVDLAVLVHQELHHLVVLVVLVIR
jgi:hypothetical protein